jgi:hypothetical protein
MIFIGKMPGRYNNSIGLSVFRICGREKSLNWGDSQSLDFKNAGIPEDESVKGFC